MKRNILFIVITFISLNAFSQSEIAKYKANQIINDKSYNLELLSNYSGKNDKIYLDVDGTTNKAFLMLKKEQRDNIKLMINKFYEWSRKADSAKIDAEKTLGFIDCSGGFEYGSKYYFDYDVNVEFIFYSFKLSDGSFIREMALKIPKMIASDNEYIDIDKRMIWIKEVDMKKFEIAISEETISKYRISEEIKNKNVDDLLK